MAPLSYDRTSPAMKLKLLLGTSALLVGLTSVGPANADIAPPHQTVRHAKTVRVHGAGRAGFARAHVGDTLVLRLGANATTGYSWRVLHTTHALGQPKQSYLPVGGGAVGGGGTAVFTWKLTKRSAGRGQIVNLAYGRAGDAPEQHFTLTANIKP